MSNRIILYVSIQYISNTLNIFVSQVLHFMIFINFISFNGLHNKENLYLCNKIAPTYKIVWGAYVLIYEIQDRGHNSVKEDYFPLVVGEKRPPSTSEACRELVSSTCMIMVAHLILTSLSQK